MTLKNVIDEAFDQKFATSIEPVIKKYYDRATQDKSPDAQVLQQLMTEISAAKQAKPQVQPQIQIQQGQ